MTEIETMHVKPNPGHLVRDPETREALPPAGKEVPWSTYWRRRLLDGSIQASTPPAREEDKPAPGTSVATEAPASGNRPKRGEK